jgi:hypothetical protein
MKKVLLLGDSIRLIGYGTKIPELLGNDYTVWQSEDNNRFAKYTLYNLSSYFKQMPDPDVIHWNNGLWDSCVKHAEDGPFTPVEEYVSDMLKILRELQKRTSNVIFVKTTHTREGFNFEGINPNRRLLVDVYNNAIVPELEKRGVFIHDLNPLIDADDSLISDDNIHLSQKGIDICAKQVADVIRRF